MPLKKKTLNKECTGEKFSLQTPWWHVLVWRLSIRSSSGGREEEILEGRRGREWGSFFPFAVSPFHIVLSPFPQKPLTLRQGLWAPDSGYLAAGQQTCWSCFCFCTVNLHELHVPICSHCSALQWMQKKQNKTKFLLVVQKLIEPACIFLSIGESEIEIRSTSCICCHVQTLTTGDCTGPQIWICRRT